MPFKTVRGDIAEFKCDAIVCAGKSGVTCGTWITDDRRVPGRLIIHTAAPVWNGGEQSRRELASCYSDSLELAKKNGCESVAFPLLSLGAKGCTLDAAYEIAVTAITDYISRSDGDIDVALVLQGKNSGGLRNLFPELKKRLCPPKNPLSKPGSACFGGNALFSAAKLSRKDADGFYPDSVMQEAVLDECASTGYRDLDMRLEHVDESFADMLFRKIDEKKLSEVQCYKKANLDRKLFSKIRSDRLYRPSKTTALALAVALELGIEETCELLLKAGYALSDSSRFDIIVRYFIEKGIYDIFEINGALFAFDQKLLGGC